VELVVDPDALGTGGAQVADEGRPIRVVQVMDLHGVAHRSERSDKGDGIVARQAIEGQANLAHETLTFCVWSDKMANPSALASAGYLTEEWKGSQ
jgi:hypothetical protein